MNKELVVTVFKSGDNLVFNYNDTIYVKDLVDIENATLVEDNKSLDTSSLGEKTIEVKYKNNRELLIYNLTYNVIDNIAPVIMGSTTHTIKKGSTLDLVNSMLCGDNYDKRPNCYIEGDYDFNKVGEYNLKYIAVDSSDNKTERDYKLIVKNKLESSGSSSSSTYQLSTLINDHKSEDTIIGIDVSSWQGSIDWSKVKSSGVEFAMIRIGFGYNSDNELVYDNRFKDNLKNAKEAGIKVGLYFYTYAKNNEEAINQAKWIVEALDGETLDLGIAFDWEIWSKFNSYNISFTDLNNMAESFFKELEKNGYEGMIYGSCSYLERIWNLPNYKTWLAHYATKTDYTKDYYIWQLSSNGKVDGISGYVDLDVLYKK